MGGLAAAQWVPPNEVGESYVLADASYSVTVVLIDEIDKADPAIPNGLLDAFGHGRFDVPCCKPVRMSRACRPGPYLE